MFGVAHLTCWWPAPSLMQNGIQRPEGHSPCISHEITMPLGMQGLKVKKKKDGKLRRAHWRPPDSSRQMQKIHHKWFQQGLLPHWTSTSLLCRHFSVDPDISGSSHSVPEFFLSDKCRIALLLFLCLQTIYDINGASHGIHYLRVGVSFCNKIFSFQAFVPHCLTFLGPGKLGDALGILRLREGNGQMNLIILTVLKVSEKQNEGAGCRTVSCKAPRCQTLEVSPQCSDHEPRFTGVRGVG